MNLTPLVEHSGATVTVNGVAVCKRLHGWWHRSIRRADRHHRGGDRRGSLHSTNLYRRSHENARVPAVRQPAGCPPELGTFLAGVGRCPLSTRFRPGPRRGSNRRERHGNGVHRRDIRQSLPWAAHHAPIRRDRLRVRRELFRRHWQRSGVAMGGHHPSDLGLQPARSAGQWNDRQWIDPGSHHRRIQPDCLAEPAPD